MRIHGQPIFILYLYFYIAMLTSRAFLSLFTYCWFQMFVILVCYFVSLLFYELYNCNDSTINVIFCPIALLLPQCNSYLIFLYSFLLLSRIRRYNLFPVSVVKPSFTWSPYISFPFGSHMLQFA